MCISKAQKQPRLQDFLNKMKTRASLVPNLDYETRKKKNMTHAKQKSNKVLLQRINKNKPRP
jgi:hypothetical protein